MNNSDNVKTIGLIHEDIFTDFAKEIIHSVVHYAIGRKDVKIVVIAGRQDESNDDHDKLHQYKQVYNTIFDIGDICGFDGLIVTLPNINMIQQYKNFMNIPKVFVATDAPGEITVNYNDEMGIRETMDYLIRSCGYTKICMLGGRDENADAQRRKKIFIRCLKENNLEYSEKQYEKSDMSVNSQKAALRLLNRNPDVQAIFCVNDQSAVGLYDVMKKRDMIPGKDIKVFGFDNTLMAGEMIPSLSSIGPDVATLGQTAMELLLAKLSGAEVCSVEIPTRLYGRSSLEYEMYEYNLKEMLNVDTAFIYRMFDDCLYRYRSEIIDRGAIDLRRLFFEFISRMLIAMKNRVMNDDEYDEICKLIDIFFENGAMKYTDADKFLKSVDRLQGAMNESQRSLYVNSKNNRLFARMKDKAIQAQAISKRMETKGYNFGRESIFDFNIETQVYEKPGPDAIDRIIANYSRLGLVNSALYMFDDPIGYDLNKKIRFPGLIYLKCIVRAGELHMIPLEKQECRLDSIFNREELPVSKKGYTAYPIFCGKYIFGMVVTGMERQLLDKGEYITSQLGRALYMNWDWDK